MSIEELNRRDWREAAADRFCTLARQADSLAKEAEEFGELEPGDMQMFKHQAVTLRRQTAWLRGRATQARREPAPRMLRRPMVRHRESRRRSVRSGPRRARAPGPLADDPEPEPVARLDGFWPASVRMVQHLERRRAKAAAA
jgi:hypothetical protein